MTLCRAIAPGHFFCHARLGHCSQQHRSSQVPTLMKVEMKRVVVVLQVVCGRLDKVCPAIAPCQPINRSALYMP
jgi:hypothetical protein